TNLVIPAGAGTSTTTAGITFGCAEDNPALRWAVGSLAPGEIKTLEYTAIVKPTTAGGTTFDNRASLIGSTIQGVPSEPGLEERSYEKTATQRNSIAKATLTKSTTTPTRTIGQTAEFTLVVTLPKD